MAFYMIEVAYNTDGCEGPARPSTEPDRRDQARARAAGRHGRRRRLAFGEYDVVAIIELPTNVSAAAFSMAVSAGGTVKAFQTTPLMSMEEAMTAMGSRRIRLRAGARPDHPA